MMSNFIMCNIYMLYFYDCLNLILFFFIVVEHFFIMKTYSEDESSSHSSGENRKKNAMEKINKLTQQGLEP